MAYVSDHAVLRYLERVEGVDIEAVRRKLSVDMIDKAAAFGCDTVVLGDGTRLKLHGNVVSTVLEARKHKHEHRNRH
jgi:hypothetical protein